MNRCTLFLFFFTLYFSSFSQPYSFIFLHTHTHSFFLFFSLWPAFFGLNAEKPS